jgi:hypothetical protein
LPRRQQGSHTRGFGCILGFLRQPLRFRQLESFFLQPLFFVFARPLLLPLFDSPRGPTPALPQRHSHTH